jgi:hypothetical protein
MIAAGGFVLVSCEAILAEVTDGLARPHVQRYGPCP